MCVKLCMCMMYVHEVMYVPANGTIPRSAAVEYI